MSDRPETPWRIVEEAEPVPIIERFPFEPDVSPSFRTMITWLIIGTVAGALMCGWLVTLIILYFKGLL